MIMNLFRLIMTLVAQPIDNKVVLKCAYFSPKDVKSPYSVATLGCSPVPFNALRVKPSPVKPSIFSTARASGWRAAPIRPSRRSAHASGPSRKMKRLTSISSFAACSKHKAGAIGSRSDGLDGYRLIAGESDGLPGITIDRFQNFLVLQLLSAGAEYQRPALLSALQHCYPECSIYDRSDVAVRKKKACRWRRARCWAICRRNCCRSPNTA